MPSTLVLVRDVRLRPPATQFGGRVGLARADGARRVFRVVCVARAAVLAWILGAASGSGPMAATADVRAAEVEAADVGAVDVGAEALSRLLGRPAVVEFPELEHFESALAGLPGTWGFLQATSAVEVAALRARLGVDEAFGLVFLDRYGNPLHRESGPGCRRRLPQGLREYERRERELRARIIDFEKQRQAAVTRNREAQEIEALGRLVALGVRGHREIESAHAKWAEFDAARWLRLVEILAGEGLVGDAQLLGELKGLQDRSPGLPVADAIRRERTRLEQGMVVERRETP